VSDPEVKSEQRLAAGSMSECVYEGPEPYLLTIAISQISQAEHRS
jgi:hypothetical protein